MLTRWWTRLVQSISRLRRALSVGTGPRPPSPRLTALLATLPDWLAGLSTFVLRRMGPILTVVVVAVALLANQVIKGWWNWNELLTKPGIAPIFSQLRPPPRADPTKFAVVIADFDNDESREFRRVVMEGLKEIHGIQLLALEQPIPYAPSDTEDARAARQQITSKFLRQSAAQILIWGTVLRVGDARVLKLFWETEPAVRAGEPFTRHEFQHSLELPESLRNRLADVLGLIVTRFRCELDASARPIRAQELLGYISRVSRLIDPEDPHPLLDTHQRAQVADAQTDAYLALSNQMRSDLPIVGAMMSLEKLLHHTSQTDTPLDRASLEFDLGACAHVLGVSKAEPLKSVLFEKALMHLHVAQTLYSNEQTLSHWAVTQMLIAFVEHSRANAQPSSPLRLAYLSRSVAAAKAALNAHPRTGGLQEARWLTTIILGCSLMLIGNEQHDAASWREAAAVFTEATAQISIERWPSGWVFAQYDAAALAGLLWQSEHNVADLLDAQTRFRTLVNLPSGALSEQQRTQFRGWLDVVDRDLATHSKTSGSGFTNQRGF